MTDEATSDGTPWLSSSPRMIATSTSDCARKMTTGSDTRVLAILDTMRLVEPDIVTYCVGQAASMGAVLLACGTKGKRYSLPHSRILIHQPSMSGLAGQATDIDIYAKEILRMRETLNQILADAAGQPVDIMPTELDATVGESIRVVNNDDADFMVMERVSDDREPTDQPWDIAMKAVDLIRRE